MGQVPEIIKLFHDIKKSSLHYCKVCLRTSKETKLVAPTNFLKFLVNALEVNYKGEDLCICHMCEAQALKALKFYQQVIFSLLADMVFHHMDERSFIIGKIAYHMQNTVKQVPNRLVRLRDVRVQCEKKNFKDIATVATDCELLLKRVRANSQLLQTDTIVVDTNKGTDVECHIEKPPSLVLRPSSSGAPEVLILDDDDVLQTDNNGEMCIINNPKPRPKAVDPKYQDVLIERQTMPELVPMNKFLASNSNNIVALTPDGNNLIDKHKSSADHFVMHPIKIGVDGQKYVPSLSAKLCGNTLVKLVNCVFQSEDDVDSNADIISDTGQNQRFNDMRSNSNEEGQNRLGNEKSHNRLGNDTDDNRLRNDTGHNTGQNDMLNNGIKRNSDGEIANKRSKIELIAGSSSNMKCGVVDKNIDWEDKIPMDVISFMDANDPNADLILSSSVMPSIQSSQSINSSSKNTEPVPCSGPIYNFMSGSDELPVYLIPESILSTSESNERQLEVCPLTLKENKEVTKPTNRAYKKTTPRKTVHQPTDVIIDLC